jgi:hypothetical protein
MEKNLSKLFCAFAFSLFLFISNSAIAVERHVPSQYPTIQAAINQAVNGDIIIVDDGIYTGTGNRDIDFLGKSITVKSKNGPTNSIVDCQGSSGHEHVGFIMDCDNCSLEGFTITGAFTTTWCTRGGGVYCAYGSPIIKNCIFLNNYSKNVGAAITINTGYQVEIINCTFTQNVSSTGGSIIDMWSCDDGTIHKATLKNCVSWNNSNPEFDRELCTKCPGSNRSSANFSILQSLWQSGWPSIADCIVADPLFADPNNDDYHLKSQRGRWDPNSKIWVTDTVTSPGVDSGDPASGYCEEAWPHGKRINLGAYGGTPEASLSVVHKGNVADITCDEQVTAPDFSAFSGQWQILDQPRREDFNHDGKIDMEDLLILVSNWLKINIDPVLLLNKTTYLSGEPIVASFSNMPGNQLDWLGLCVKGASIEPYAGAIIEWYYTDGTQTSTPGITEGSVTFTSILEPEEYEIRLFFDNDYDIQDRKFLKVQ